MKNTTRIGRLFFLVESHSRSGMQHCVDLETMECTCENYLLYGRPCKHIKGLLRDEALSELERYFLATYLLNYYRLEKEAHETGKAEPVLP